MSKPTTKECPKCKAKNLALVATLNYKYCVTCNVKVPWHLADNQKPLLY